MNVSQKAIDRFLTLSSFNNDAKQMVNISKSNKEGAHVTQTISAINANALNIIHFFKDIYGNKSQDLLTNEMRSIIVNTINQDIPPEDDDYDKREEIYKKNRKFISILTKTARKFKLVIHFSFHPFSAFFVFLPV
jgi:hypothetical protein